MMGFGFTLAPDTHNTGLITMVATDTATTVTRTNIGGSEYHHRHHYDRDYQRDYDRD